MILHFFFQLCSYAFPSSVPSSSSVPGIELSLVHAHQCFEPEPHPYSNLGFFLYFYSILTTSNFRMHPQSSPGQACILSAGFWQWLGTIPAMFRFSSVSIARDLAQPHSRPRHACSDRDPHLPQKKRPTPHETVHETLPTHSHCSLISSPYPWSLVHLAPWTFLFFRCSGESPWWTPVPAVPSAWTIHLDVYKLGSLVLSYILKQRLLWASCLATFRVPFLVHPIVPATVYFQTVSLSCLLVHYYVHCVNTGDQ